MSPTMRVLHVIPTIALEHGGPSHAVRTMAQSVAERGVEVDVATTSYGTPQGKEDPKRTWEYVDCGVTYRQFPFFRRTQWCFSAALTRWLLANARRYDVFHIHAPFTYPTLAACTAARLAGVPYLYRTIGALDPWSLKQGSRFKGAYFRLLEFRNLRAAHTVHVTSNAEAESVSALRVAPRKIAILPLGIPERPEHKHYPADPPIRILFVGRLHPKKGLPLLIGALAALRAEGADVVLDIAGSGDGAYVSSLAKQVRELGVDAAVRFCGFVEGQNKMNLFRDAHIAVLPAYDENFGIFVAEAMASGLPVVVSDGVGIAPRVRGAGAGRVCATGDQGSLIQALRELLPPAERESCGFSARALAIREFSTSLMADRLLELYQQLRVDPNV